LLFKPFPPRPRYMHRKTYNRLRETALHLEAGIIGSTLDCPVIAAARDTGQTRRAALNIHPPEAGSNVQCQRKRAWVTAKILPTGQGGLAGDRKGATAPATAWDAANEKGLLVYEPFHYPPRLIGSFADQNFVEGYLSQLRPDVVF